VTGRIAITHPTEKLIALKQGDPKIYRDTVDVISQKETDKKIRI